MGDSPKKKRQHYVPRMLLKRFGHPDGKRCDVFVLSSGKLIRAVPTKGQCQESYFYGKDQKLEEKFETLEGDASSAYRELEGAQRVWSKGSKESVNALLFLVSLKARTLSAANDLEAVAGDFLNEFIKPSVAKAKGISKELLEKATLKISEPAQLSIAATAPHFLICLDLSLKVLVSPEDTPFVLGDDPVFSVNQAYTTLSKSIGTTGFAMKGLQIFLPITPRFCLFYFDPGFYKVGTARSSDFIEVEPEDVERINLCSVSNSEEKFFVSPGMKEKDVKNLAAKAAKFRVERRAKTVMERAIGPDGNESELAHSYEEDLRLPLDWKFCTIRRDRRGRKHPEFGVRDESFMDAHRRFFSEPSLVPQRLPGFFKFAFEHFGIPFNEEGTEASSAQGEKPPPKPP